MSVPSVYVWSSWFGGKSKWTPPRVVEIRPLCQGLFRYLCRSLVVPTSICWRAPGISSQPSSLMAQTTDLDPLSKTLRARF